ncbi:hypothetical protein [Polaromonas sp. C04]|uniref:hypothetical protein n=1 Tax=Polaromonas sp. C04 TaxID=1945857 RepID=UPI0009863392|nr:hypothetical protein [Polaromonas sp. C04]OOG57991.1 hypothetical protein B0E49_03880 [Polaromonas sp. C04]
MPKTETVDRYDRVAFRLDRAELGVDLKTLLKPWCRDTTLTVYSPKYHPRWKSSVLVLQPESEWFLRFLELLGADVAVEVEEVEIARDFIVWTRIEAYRLHRLFLGSVLVPYLRHKVVHNRSVTYFAPRGHRSGVLAVYSDEWFKPTAPTRERPCLHVEMRLSNTGAARQHELIKVQDFIDYDFDAFWAKRLQFVTLPHKKTDLGRLLGTAAQRHVSGTALRKRADKLLTHSSNRVAGHFVLQNAAREHAAPFRKLPRIGFRAWERDARAAALMPLSMP